MSNLLLVDDRTPGSQAQGSKAALRHGNLSHQGDVAEKNAESDQQQAAPTALRHCLAIQGQLQGSPWVRTRWMEASSHAMCAKAGPKRACPMHALRLPAG